MTANIRSDASGLFGAIGFGGDDAITFDAGGIVGGYKDNTITPAKLTQKPTKIGPFTLSGSAQDITGIPSWVQKITVSLVGVSGATALTSRLRVGTSAGVATTGYTGSLVTLSTTPGVLLTDLGASPVGLAAVSTTAAATTGTGQFTLIHQGGNVWSCFGGVDRKGDTQATSFSFSSVTLPGILDRISLVATTGTFDAGTMAVIYEG